MIRDSATGEALRTDSEAERLEKEAEHAARLAAEERTRILEAELARLRGANG